MSEQSPDNQNNLRHRVVGSGRRFAIAFSSRMISTCASSVAFFFFLSLIPLVILLSMLLPHLGFSYTLMAEGATSLTPDMVDPLVLQILREAYSASGRLVSAAILLLIWSSSAGMLALIRGLNVVYEVRERRSYPVMLLLSIFYTAILLLLFISMMYLAIFSESLRGIIYEVITDRDAAVFGYEGFRYQIAFLLSVIIFSLMYTFIPAGRRRFLMQLPGALFTAAGFVVFSWFFSIYLRGGNRYTLFYGSLAGTAIFLFWLYCCFYIFLIGAHLNHYFEAFFRRTGRRALRRLREYTKKS